MSKEQEPPFFGVQLFGWDIFRIFRDNEGEMLCIVLEKDGLFKEFVTRSEAKKRYGNEYNS